MTIQLAVRNIIIMVLGANLFQEVENQVGRSNTIHIVMTVDNDLLFFMNGRDDPFRSFIQIFHQRHIRKILQRRKKERFRNIPVLLDLLKNREITTFVIAPLELH